SGLLGQKSMLEVGVGMEDHRSGTVLHAVDLEHAIEDVPDLGEVVVMERMPGPLLVAHDPCVWHRGIAFGGMEHHLRELAVVPQVGPAQVVRMPHLHRPVVVSQRPAGPTLVKNGLAGDGIQFLIPVVILVPAHRRLLLSVNVPRSTYARVFPDGRVSRADQCDPPVTPPLPEREHRKRMVVMKPPATPCWPSSPGHS